jgi:hypothetical protein
MILLTFEQHKFTPRPSFLLIICHYFNPAVELTKGDKYYL